MAEGKRSPRQRTHRHPRPTRTPLPADRGLRLRTTSSGTVVTCLSPHAAAPPRQRDSSATSTGRPSPLGLPTAGTVPEVGQQLPHDPAVLHVVLHAEEGHEGARGPPGSLQGEGDRKRRATVQRSRRRCAPAAGSRSGPSSGQPAASARLLGTAAACRLSRGRALASRGAQGTPRGSCGAALWAGRSAEPRPLQRPAYPAPSAPPVLGEVRAELPVQVHEQVLVA